MFKHIRDSKRYDGMNRLSKEYTTTNNKEKVKAQYTYGKTGGVTYEVVLPAFTPLLIVVDKGV